MGTNEHIEKLKELRLYGKFAHNLNAFRSLSVEDYCIIANGYSFRTFLLCAFYFDETPEGLAFWSNII